MIYTPERREWMFENVKGRSHRELTDMFNERFGTEVTVEQTKGFISRNHLNTGRTGRFQKGGVSWNKGKKGIHHGSSTSYKKGSIPPNRVPIGTEKMHEDGYTFVKVKDGCANRNWIQKHRMVWEEANGPIPDGHVVMFANGDSTDTRLDNLVLAMKSDMTTINKLGLKPYDRESAEAAVLTARLIQSARKKELKCQGGSKTPDTNGRRSHRHRDSCTTTSSSTSAP